MDSDQTHSLSGGAGSTEDLGGGRRSWLAAVIRLAVCLAAVGWLYKTTDWGDVRNVLATAKANWHLALVGLLAYGPAPLLISLRLKWLLIVHDIHLTFWKAVKVTFMGNFVIQALPVGTPGGDALKAWYIARETPHKHEAVITVLFDRVIGVVGLVILSGLMVLANWNNPAMASWGAAATARPWMNVLGPRMFIGLLVLVLLLGGGVYFSHWCRRVLRLERIIERLPLAGHLQRIDQAAFEFRSRHRRVAACLALSIVLQLFGVLSVFLGGWALGVVPADRPWRAFPIYLAYAPICFLFGVLPLGIMEVVYVQLFAHAAGLGSRAAALSLSLLTRLFQLAWSTLGGVAILTGRSSTCPASAAIVDTTQTQPGASLRQ